MHNLQFTLNCEVFYDDVREISKCWHYRQPTQLVSVYGSTSHTYRNSVQYQALTFSSSPLLGLTSHRWPLNITWSDTGVICGNSLNSRQAMIHALLPISGNESCTQELQSCQVIYLERWEIFEERTVDRSFFQYNSSATRRNLVGVHNQHWGFCSWGFSIHYARCYAGSILGVKNFKRLRDGDARPENKELTEGGCMWKPFAPQTHANICKWFSPKALKY